MNLPSKDIESRIHEWYLKKYRTVFETGAFGFVHRQMHRQIETYSQLSEVRNRVLELGAWGDQHRAHVNHTYSQYYLLDILFPRELRALEENGVFQLGADAQSLPFPRAYFDRLVASCLIMHMRRPEDVLAEWRRVVKPGGRLTIYVHNDPGLLLRATRVFVKKKGAREMSWNDYNLLQYGQHAVSYPAVMTFIEFVFSGHKIRRRQYPFPWFSWNLNWFTVVDILIAPDGAHG